MGVTTVNRRKAIAEATSALMATVGAFLVVAGLLPFINPGLTAVRLRNTPSGVAPILVIVLLIAVGVVLMVAGLKLSKQARSME